MGNLTNLISLEKFIPALAGEHMERGEVEQTSYRPTLLIFIGGTGYLIAIRLKKLLRHLLPEELLGIFQFIVFDTTAQKVPPGEQPLDAGEFFHLGDFDAADMIRHLDENEYIASWWPGGIERPYRPTFSGTGSQGVRAVGRLVAFHYMGSIIIPRMEAKIDRAIEVNAQHGMGATSLKIFVVYSVAGGTGSGMGLDIAYNARLLALQRQPTAYVTGVLVTEDPYLPKAKTRNQAAHFSANALAALMEINHFSMTRTFHERYSDLISTEELPEETFRPFDVAYLLGLHNSGGQALASVESLADMIAAQMMVEIASRLHGHTTNVLDNVHANDNFIAGQPAAFSSFALSSLFYPLHGIASWCALKGLADFSSKVLLSPIKKASDVEKDVIAFTQTNGVEEELANHLIDRLNTDEKAEQMAPPSISHYQVDGLPEEQLLGTLQRLEENALADLADIRERIIENTPATTEKFSSDLAIQVDSLMRDTKRGPRYLTWFLSSLSHRLTNQRDVDMIGEQSLSQAQVDANQAAYNEAFADLANAMGTGSWNPQRGRKIDKCRTAYAIALNAYLNAKIDLEKRTQAIVCLDAFISEIAELVRLANDLVKEWERLSKASSNRAGGKISKQQATETQYSLMHNIVGHDELESTYDRYFPELEEQNQREHLASQFWSFFSDAESDWTLALGSPSNIEEGSPAVQVYYFLANLVARQLSNMSLIERLQEIYGTKWQHEIELIYRKTVPFWNYKLGRFNNQILNNLQEEPSLVGYGEDNEEEWTEMVQHATGQNIDGVNNKNKHEMLFLKTSHGLPLFAIRTAAKLRTAYRYFKKFWAQADPRSNPIPVHISRVWELEMEGIDPQGSLQEVEPESAADPSSNGGQPQSEQAAPAND